MEQRVFPKIIMHMKTRFQRDENFPISLEDILDEMQIVECNRNTRMILDNQILCNNPKLEVTIEDNVKKYTFKPIYNLKNRKDLIKLVVEHQTKGLGGILLENVQESMTTEEFEKIFNKKPSEELVVLMGKEKKKVLYYNDLKSAENLRVDEEIIKHWRDVAIEGLDENKIDEYLEKQGIASMKDAFANSIMQTKPGERRKTTQRGRQSKMHNTHLGNVLNEYNPDLVRKPNPK